MIVRRLKAKVERWHLLGRYYVNKWHYDGSKLLDRVLYGQGSTGNGPQVASVAFMITRGMRQQLLDSGFPPSAISTLLPATAQKIIADKITFAQFQELQKQQQVQQAAEKAKQALIQEEQHQWSSLVVEKQIADTQDRNKLTYGALVVKPEEDQDENGKKSTG